MAIANPDEVLHAHRKAMAAAVAANDAQPSDAAGRFILDGLTARLARLLAALDRDLARPLGGPFGTAGRWGPNGRGPEIEDLIRRSALARLPVPDAKPHPGRPNVPHDPPCCERTEMPCPTATERSFLYSALIAVRPATAGAADGGAPRCEASPTRSIQKVECLEERSGHVDMEVQRTGLALRDRRRSSPRETLP